MCSNPSADIVVIVDSKAGWCTADLLQGRKESSDGWAVGDQEAPGRGISVDVDLARQVADGDQNTSDQLQVRENLKKKQMQGVRCSVFSHP